MKLIPLSQSRKRKNYNKNLFAIVDDDMFDIVNQFIWYASICDNTIYAVTNETKSRKKIFLHRFIMKTPKGLVVDHRDKNGLNCRKYNMRNCTYSQNNQNRRKKIGATSKYFGVYYQNRKVKYITKIGIREYVRKGYVCRIKINGKYKHLGEFKTEIEAAKAFNEAAKIHHKEFANLNNFNLTREFSKTKGVMEYSMTAEQIKINQQFI